MSMREPNADHSALYNALLDAIKTTASDMDSLEILAVLSQVVGKWVAFCDASLPPGSVMELVARNVEIGNADALAFIIGVSGGKN